MKNCEKRITEVKFTAMASSPRQLASRHHSHTLAFRRLFSTLQRHSQAFLRHPLVLQRLSRAFFRLYNAQ